MDLEEQLRAALAPATPRSQVRAEVLQRIAAQPSRRSSTRAIWAGALIALAAAAAMMATQWQKPAAPGRVAAVASAPTPIPVAEEMPALSPVAASSASRENAEAPLPPATRFTVQIMSVEFDGADAASKAAFEAVQAALVTGLRAVPGAVLVESASSGNAQQPDYRLKLEGKILDPASAPDPGDYRVRMEAQRLGPGGQPRGSLFIGTVGEFRPACASAASMDVLSTAMPCKDAVGVATVLLSTLRKSVFPPDPQLQRRLQARLADTDADPAQRLHALSDLSLFGSASGTSPRGAFNPALRDPAVVRAAVQLAATTPDPAARAQIWYILRGSSDPTLVPPLIEALRADADDDSRVQALTTLMKNAGDDPRVHAAMEAAAAMDSDPLVRALAARAIGGDAAWTQYVLDSLQDAGRSPLERVEALFFAYGLPSSRTYGSFAADGRILRQLDDASLRALTEVLPKAAAESRHYQQASHTLMSELAYRDHAAITDLLLDAVASEAEWLDRSWAIDGLKRRSNEPRVRAALERMAAENADPRWRTAARNALSGHERDKEVMATMPPRLGVGTQYLTAAPGVPPDLVGKLAVERISMGSAAERAGMREADVLLEIDGTPITSGPQLIQVLDGLEKGVDVNVIVSREGQVVRLTAKF